MILTAKYWYINESWQFFESIHSQKFHNIFLKFYKYKIDDTSTYQEILYALYTQFALTCERTLPTGVIVMPDLII